MLALAPLRSKAAGLPDLLNYAALVDEGVVLGKDGSLMAGLFFRGDNAASAITSERNHLATLVNQYLSHFGMGWSLWTDASRSPSPGYPRPDEPFSPEPATAMIDAERRASFVKDHTLFENEYVLIPTYLLLTRRDSELSEMVYDDDDIDDIDPADRLLADSRKKLDDLQDGLGDLPCMRRMDIIEVGEDDDTYQNDELINYLHYTLTNEPIALRIPDCPMYLDAQLGYSSLWPDDTLKVSDKFMSYVAIEGFPGNSYPGILDMLGTLLMAYCWSPWFILLEQYETVAAPNRYRLKWQQKTRGFWSQTFKSQKGMINTDALKMAQESEIAINDAAPGLAAYGYCTPVIILIHEGRAFLAEQLWYVKRKLERKGFTAHVESVNVVKAWFGALPGHTSLNVRRPLVHTLNLVDLLPLASLRPGLRECPRDLYPAGSPPLIHTVATGVTPFRLNLHMGDVDHGLVFGPTGAGKSTLLAAIHAQFRRYRSRHHRDGGRVPTSITAFDKGHSLYALYKTTSGVHYDIGNDESGTPALTPLVDIDNESEMLQAEEWVATCYELQVNKPPTPQQKTEIHCAMNLLHEAPCEFRLLTDYVSTVQGSDVRDALNHYTISGSIGYLLDGKEGKLRTSIYTVYEIDDPMEMGSNDAIPTPLYLFCRSERSLTGQPAMPSLDKVWMMLGHPAFVPKIRKWLKELCRKSCLVIMVMQSLSDAVPSGLFDVLLEQCPTKTLLPNKEAHLHGTKETSGPTDLYTMPGLNLKETQILKTGRYKHDHCYKSPLGRHLFELGLGSLALAFAAVSDKEDLAEVRHLITDHGDDWPLHWLEHKGVDHERYVSHKAA